MSLHLITGYAGKEHVTSADQGSFNAAAMGEGQFVLERGSQFAAQIISNNKVRVLDGDLMMQGRHIRLNENTYEELDFENGTQSEKRNDLIVVRYTKDATTGIENIEFAVKKGTPTTGTPIDPEVITGDLLHDNALLAEFALYRVPFSGLVMQELVCLFDVVPNAYAAMEKNMDARVGVLANLKTTVKSNVVNAINSLADSVTSFVNNSVTGVKGANESAYRTGNVNITKENIGLGNVENTKDADKEVKWAASCYETKFASVNRLKETSIKNVPLELGDYVSVVSEDYDEDYTDVDGELEKINLLRTNVPGSFLVVRIGIPTGAWTIKNVIIPFPPSESGGVSVVGFNHYEGNHYKGILRWKPSNGILEGELTGVSEGWANSIKIIDVWAFNCLH